VNRNVPLSEGSAIHSNLNANSANDASFPSPNQVTLDSAAEMKSPENLPISCGSLCSETSSSSEETPEMTVLISLRMAIHRRVPSWGQR